MNISESDRESRKTMTKFLRSNVESDVLLLLNETKQNIITEIFKSTEK